MGGGRRDVACARTSYYAIEKARESGIKVGELKLNIVWPFPEKIIKKWASKVKAIIVPELNMGQMVLEVERSGAGKWQVISVPHPGGDIHRPDEILEAIRKSVK